MKLTKATIATLSKLGYSKPIVAEIRTNPYTGKTHLLEPEAVMLYDFITTSLWVCGKQYTRAVWDNARYYFASKWSNEYYGLLD